MVADECDFELEGMCCPPKEHSGFICKDSEMRDGFRYCNGSNDNLITEDEYDQRINESLKKLFK